MSKSAIIIGAGITGVCAAEWMRREGWDITLVDRINPGDPDQTSYGNGGILARCAIVPVAVPGLMLKAPKMLLDPKSPLFMRWSYLPRLMPWIVPFIRNSSRSRMERIVRALDPLTNDSVDQHLALAKGTGAEKYISTGDYAYLYRSRKDFEADAMGMALRREYGFVYDEIERAAMLERDPHLGPDYNFSASFRDHGWVTNPGAYVAALARHFEDNGGKFTAGEVVDVTPGETPNVTLKGDTVLHADKVILAAGIWSARLAKKLGHKPALETERGYHMILKSPSFQPPTPYMVADAKFVATPMEAGLRLAGVVEFGGLKAPASRKPLELLKSSIRRVYPTLEWQDEETWLGHRPSTVDSLPMLGNATKAPGVIFAFGSQHIGLTIGPRLGRMVADIAADRRVNTDITPYRVDRFD